MAEIAEKQFRACWPKIKDNPDAQKALEPALFVLKKGEFLISLMEKFLTPEQFKQLGSNPIEMYFQTVKNVQKHMDELHSILQRGRLRSYTTEDQADEAAITILKFLKMNPAAMAEGLLIRAQANTPGPVQDCREKVRNGTEPRYGALDSQHHSDCWRFWRSYEFSKRYDRLPHLN